MSRHGDQFIEKPPDAACQRSEFSAVCCRLARARGDVSGKSEGIGALGHFSRPLRMLPKAQTKPLLIPKRRYCWLLAETSAFRSVVAKFAGAPLGFHDLSYVVEMPRLKIV